MDKPHKGCIANWNKVMRNSMTWDVSASNPEGANKGYDIIGLFIDNPDFGTAKSRTTLVLTHDEETGEIETTDAFYRLLGLENGPEKT